MKWTRAIAMLIVLTSIMEARADRGLRLGTPTYGGTGCPAGTASVSVSPDETEISILYDNFVAEAGRTTGRPLDRKSCNLNIPVIVPSGYSIAVFQTDNRGFNSVPVGAYTRVDTEYFWAGIRGPRFSKMYRGPVTDVFTETTGVLASAMVWSACGDSVNLRINNSIVAQSNRQQEQTMIAVDSSDISASLVYRLQWRSCHGWK